MSEPSRNGRPLAASGRAGPAVVFCERTGDWAVAWRRVWSRRSRQYGHMRLIETRSAAHCLDVLAAGAFVVVELAPAACDAALELLYDIQVRFPQLPRAVVAARRLSAYEWLARELGALEFVTTPLALDRLCLLAARHVARWRPPHENFAQRIWDELPWKA